MQHLQDRYSKYLSKFSAENFMDPSAIPIKLSPLTDLEKILIARIHPIMFVYRVKGQQYKYCSNVINFAQDVNFIAGVLPYNLADLSAILIINRSRSHANEYANKEFRVQCEFARQAVDWLKHNNAYYNDIIIDSESFQKLPADGISADLPYTSQDEVKYQDGEEKHTMCTRRGHKGTT